MTSLSTGGALQEYEHKFAGLIKAIKRRDAEIFIVATPHALGDNYEELVESLNRIADSGKKLVIVPRKDHQTSANESRSQHE